MVQYYIYTPDSAAVLKHFDALRSKKRLSVRSVFFLVMCDRFFLIPSYIVTITTVLFDLVERSNGFIYMLPLWCDREEPTTIEFIGAGVGIEKKAKSFTIKITI